tara:strand:+ start:373 stop:543 length:171 start_codon:yes stop_codon:yes gene_type:complete
MIIRIKDFQINVIIIFLIFTILVSVSGCGNKGPLTVPVMPDQQNEESAINTPVPVT